MSGEMISIAGLEKAAVFAALYNRARPQGMGFMHYDPTPMTVEVAREQIGLGDDHTAAEDEMIRAGVIVVGRNSLRFDYVKGRVMKVDLNGDEFDPWAYDRDNGAGAAAEAIASIRDHGTPNDQVVQAGHHLSTRAAADMVYAHFHDESRLEVENGVPTLRLGFSHNAEELLPKVRQATEETDVDDNGD